MSRTFTTIVVCTALSLASTAGARAGSPVRITLLPVQRVRVPGISQVSDELLSAALHVVFSETADFELVEFSTLRGQFEDELIDDAVFELVVTDDLKHTLQALEVFDTGTGDIARYRETAERQGIGYLAEVTFEGRRDATQIHYRLTETRTGRVALAGSFAYIPSEAARIARETARRLERDLWKLARVKDQPGRKGRT